MCLSPDAAAFVDAHVAAVAHKIGLAQLTRLIEEAIARFDPEQAEADRLAAAESRRMDVDLAPGLHRGHGAHRGRARPGRRDRLQRRPRCRCPPAAAGRLHRVVGRTPLHRGRQPGPQPSSTLDLQPSRPQRPGTAAEKKREVVLHVHLEHAAVQGIGGGAGGLARVQEAPGPVTAEQVRTWCANPDAQITVQPVLDLAEHLHVNAYQASARLKLQTQLRDGTCVFAFCFRPAEDCDCEHRVPADPDRDDGGPTCSCNQAPCCRRHHRAKTTGGWTYVTVEPGVYLWRSPLGYQFLRDPTGTLDVTPDDERRELARTFLAHFGEP